VDIDPETYLMDVTKVEAAITPRTKAILPVHLFGQCVDMDPLLDIAKSHHLYVVEDCAQAHGAEYKGRKAGSMGDISTTSFYPTKILGGYGDGGMVNTNDETLAQHLRRLRFYGAETTYYANEHGYNSRLDELQAALLLTKLPKIEQYIHRRREIAALYQKGLKETELILPKEASYGRHAYYLYVVRHPNRDEIVKKLRENDIHVNISYPWPIHTMKAYQYLGWQTDDLPETEAAAKEIFSLPMYPSLTNEEVARVVEVIRQLF
jgi:aminotransferase EvaB